MGGAQYVRYASVDRSTMPWALGVRGLLSECSMSNSLRGPSKSWLPLASHSLLANSRLVQCPEESLCIGCRLGGPKLGKQPPRCAVYGHEQIASAVLVLNLEQVLHIHVHVARLVAREGLVSRRRRLGFERVEVARPRAAQAAVEARA